MIIMSDSFLKARSAQGGLVQRNPLELYDYKTGGLWIYSTIRRSGFVFDEDDDPSKIIR